MEMKNRNASKTDTTAVFKKWGFSGRFSCCFLLVFDSILQKNEMRNEVKNEVTVNDTNFFHLFHPCLAVLLILPAMAAQLLIRQQTDLYATLIYLSVFVTNVNDHDMNRHKSMLDYLHTAGFTKTYDQLRAEAPILVFIPPSVALRLGHWSDLPTARLNLDPTRPDPAFQRIVVQEMDERDQNAKKVCCILVTLPPSRNERRLDS